MIPETESAPDIHKTGSKLADKAVAFSALFVSLCSLAIALHHALLQLAGVSAAPGAAGQECG